MQLRVSARRLWNDTGMDVREGDLLDVEASGHWWDLAFRADASGYDAPAYMRRFETLRRCADARWFELTGCVGGDVAQSFPIGARPQVPITRAGRLCLYANDAPGFYWNNFGSLTVTLGLTRPK